jgi:hypothetical protein
VCAAQSGRARARTPATLAFSAGPMVSSSTCARRGARGSGARQPCWGHAAHGRPCACAGRLTDRNVSRSRSSSGTNAPSSAVATLEWRVMNASLELCLRVNGTGGGVAMAAPRRRRLLPRKREARRAAACRRREARRAAACSGERRALAPLGLYSAARGQGSPPSSRKRGIGTTSVTVQIPNLSCPNAAPRRPQ